MQQSMPRIMLTFPSCVAPYGYMVIVTQISPASLFYRGGSLAQPPIARVEDTQWEARTTQQLITEDDDDAGNAKDEAQEALLGRDGGNDDADKEDYRLAPPFVHRNPLCDRRPPPYDTHSPRQHDLCNFFF